MVDKKFDVVKMNSHVAAVMSRENQTGKFVSDLGCSSTRAMKDQIRVSTRSKRNLRFNIYYKYIFYTWKLCGDAEGETHVGSFQ